MSETNRNAIPWVTIFVMVLATLKLTGNIAISWFWVFFPAIASVGVALLLMVFALVVVAFARD